MMDMMQADITAEPLKHFRQFVIRAPFQSSLQRVPMLMTGPIHSLELMLDVKKPHPEGPGNQDYRQLNQQIGS
jgi:hypothetical protein